MSHSLHEVLDAVSSGGIDNVLAPVDSVFSEHPAIVLDFAETRKCKNGAPCRVANTRDGTYRFYGLDNEFLLLGKIEGGSLRVIKRFYSN